MLEYLKGKLVIDIGSGMTHKNPYSLINLIARNDSKNTGVNFIGIEPKVNNDKFSMVDRIRFSINNFLRILHRQIQNKNIHKDTPGEKNIIPAKAEELPFNKEVADIILSDFLVGYWIKEPDQILKILNEFCGTLKSNGQIRLYPITKFGNKFLENPQVKEFIDDNFTTERKRLLLILTKKIMSV